MSYYIPPGLGWHRDLPDPRDYTPRHEEVAEMLDALKSRRPSPERIDWRDFFAAVEDQKHLETSVAHACVGLLRYFERRASGRIIEPSRLFVYKTAQRLLRWRGDGGIQLRPAWKAIARFGVPPERHWPYDPAKLGQEPDAFAYCSTQRFSSLRYVRLDSPGKRGTRTLRTVKSFLAAGFPSVFGFPVCTSLSTEAEIPLPTIFDGIRGGQAVVAVGDDQNRRTRAGRGALLILNSWGPDWGENGFGWLPYAYVREHLAVDFWTLLEPDWLASGEFDRPQ